MKGFPAEAANGIPDGVEADAVVIGQRSIWFSGGMPAARIEHLLSTELWFSNAARVAERAWLSTLGDHVRAVGPVRSEEKMGRVHTVWRVAVVAHQQGLRKRTVGPEPRQSMRTLPFSIEFETAIAAGSVEFGFPQPATAVDLFDLAPKPPRVAVSHLSAYHHTPWGAN